MIADTLKQIRVPRILPWTVVVLVGIYSATLITTEFFTSQEFVRHFVTDISGPVPFYAINTTISVACLWGAALLFLAAAHLKTPARPRTAPAWWLLSQCLVFAYLGCDDRFKIHETLGGWLDVGDHYILLAVAGVECLLLALAWCRGWFDQTALWCLAGGGVLFALMIGVDALAPHDLILRLSVEDALKTWSCLYFLRFAWLMMFARIYAVNRPDPETEAWRGDIETLQRGQVSLVAAAHEVN